MTHLLPLLLSLTFSGDVTLLGDEDWRTRERAQARLEAYDFLSWRQAQKAASTSPDPEVRKRAAEVVGRYLDVGRCRPFPELIGLKAWPMRWNEEFGYWYYDGENPDLCPRRQLSGANIPLWLRPLYAAYLEPLQVFGCPDAFWAEDCRYATYRLARDLLQLGVPKPAVRYFLAEPNGPKPKKAVPQPGGY